MKKILYSFILSILVVTALMITVAAATIVDSGECGDNITYTLDSDGLLTISGTGAMKDYTFYSYVPWYSSRLSVKRVVIKNGVTSIGDYAFNECSSLTSVEIPDSVTTIGYDAFSGCSSLTSVEIPDSVTSIGSSAFYGCSSLTYVYVSSLEAWCNIDFGGYYSNPTYYAKGLFVNGVYLTELVIPDGVTTIGDYAFRGCTSLTSVVIPDSVTTIGNYAFLGCSSLTYVYVSSLEVWCNIEFGDSSANPTCYAKGLFVNGVYLTEFVIPDSVTTIGNYAFYGCSSLTSVEIGDSVTTIGSYAFSSCSRLTSVVVPDSVTTIGDYAFEGCSSLTSVEIGDSVTTIGSYAFSSCSSLTSIEIGDSVTTIGSYAFSGCSKLTSVEISDSVTSIGERAFYGCSSLTSIEIPEGVTSIGYEAFYACSKLTRVNITSLEAWCNIGFGSYANPLYYAGTLYLNGERVEGELILPDGIENVKSYAFYNLEGVTSVKFPSGVKTVQANAFSNMGDLTDIYVPSTTTMIAGTAFNNSSLNVHGFVGTYAERFATVKGYNFIPLDDVLYTITYNANGGVFTTESQIKGHDGDIYIPSAKPARTGATFMGWALEKDGEPVYSAGDKFTLNSDTTLWAVWNITSLEALEKKVALNKTVALPVTLSDNQGINSIKLTLDFNRDALELISVENGEVFFELEDVNVSAENPIIMLTNELKDTTVDGMVVTLNFKVKEEASLGEYPVTLTYREVDVINVNSEEIPLKIINGKITVVDTIAGDSNGDGVINMKDSLLLRKHLAGWSVEADEPALDVNGDGDVNMKDALLLRKYLAGWQVELG